MKDFFLVIISSVVSGIIVGIFGYLFLTAGPAKPAIDVFQTTLDLPLDAGSKLLDSSSGNNVSGYIVQKFNINNYGGVIYRNLTIKPDGFKRAVLEQGGKAELLTDHQAKDYTLVPGETIRVFAVSDGYSYDYGMVGDGRIQVSVGDDPIATRTEQTDNTGPLSDMTKVMNNNPFITFILVVALGLGGVIFWLILLVVGTMMRFFPKTYIKSFGNKDTGRLVALLGWLKKEHPDKWENIRSHAAAYAKEQDLGVPKLPATTPEAK
ncbi:hypothetical protein [Mesorhizobium sp. 113-3-3]|uniref:hypothetical protein n=1 Tax=Mesorhizobium sp. 113-3-3 TaxID=2744516 RepID=UPI0019293C5E|nr:hypothetical protein [Mesorhizobium sp. 113-3-3]BCG79898.1 hypothetical protein MesoLj113b_34400 [Mesorhizobium sp. 113-3-3]